MVEKILYDRRSAAEALSISPRTLDYYLSRHELQTRRIGRKVLIPRAELLRFAKADHFGPVDHAANPEEEVKEAA